MLGWFCRLFDQPQVRAAHGHSASRRRALGAHQQSSPDALPEAVLQRMLRGPRYAVDGVPWTDTPFGGGPGRRSTCLNAPDRGRKDRLPQTPAGSKDRSPRISGWARDPRIRDPRAHQTCCGDGREGGLAFRMARAKKHIPAETTPMAFNKVQTRTHFR